MIAWLVLTPQRLLSASFADLFISVNLLKLFVRWMNEFMVREQFHRTSEIHDYNLRGSNYDLQLPLPKTNFLKRSFSYRGAMAWNQLSNETREMGDLTSFKLAIS